MLIATTHLPLLDDSGIELEVNMFGSLQIDAAQIARRALLGLNQALGFLQYANDSRFILKSVHILIAMSVAALQHFNELFVHSLDTR